MANKAPLPTGFSSLTSPQPLPLCAGGRARRWTPMNMEEHSYLDVGILIGCLIVGLGIANPVLMVVALIRRSTTTIINRCIIVGTC